MFALSFQKQFDLMVKKHKNLFNELTPIDDGKYKLTVKKKCHCQTYAPAWLTYLFPRAFGRASKISNVQPTSSLPIIISLFNTSAF